MVMLVLLIRFKLGASNVLLVDQEMFASHAFSESEAFLCKKLLKVGRDVPVRASCSEFHNHAGNIIRQRCRAVQAAIEDFRAKQGKEHAQPRGGAVQPAPTSAGVVEQWRVEQVKVREMKKREKSSAADALLALIHVSFNLCLFLKAGQNDKSPSTIVQVGDSGAQEPLLCQDPGSCSGTTARDEFLLEEGGRTRATVAQQYVDVLTLINECLQKETGDPRCLRLLEKEEVCLELLKILPSWEIVETTGPLTEEKELAMQLFECKCRLAVNVMRAGWARGRAFSDIAHRFHKAFDAKTATQVQDFVPDVKDTYVDPHDWVLRLQTMALTEMFDAIPQDLRTREELEKLSRPVDHPDLFRPEVEIRAVMDGATSVMESRGTPVKCTLKCPASSAQATKTLHTVLSSFTDDLLLKPHFWEKSEVQKSLEFLISDGEVWQLTSMSFKLMPDGEVQFWTPTDHRELKAKFLSTGADEQLQSQVDLRDAIFTFGLSQVKEVETPSQLAAGTPDQWVAYDTNMLKLLASWVDSTIEAMMPQEIDGPQQGIAKKAKAKFQEFRETVETQAMAKITEQVAKLESFRRNTADPDDCACLSAFRKAPETQTEEDRKTFKDQHFNCLEQYEDVHERYRLHLEDRLKGMFQWSSKVTNHVENQARDLATALKELRAGVRDYWAALESEVTTQAKKQQEEAQDKQMAAQDAAKAAERQKLATEEEIQTLRAQSDTERQDNAKLQKESQQSRRTIAQLERENKQLQDQLSKVG